MTWMVIVMTTIVSNMHASPHITAESPLPWLRVTTSSAPQFTSRVQQTLGSELANGIAEVLPYSVVITNDSVGPLVGIAVRFNVKTAQRTVTRDFFYYSFPEPTKPVLAAGESRVFTPLTRANDVAHGRPVPRNIAAAPLQTWSSGDVSAISMIAASDEIHVAIEVIVGPDGRTAGADQTRSLAQLTDQLQGYHSMISECRARLTNGISNIGLEAWLEQFERTSQSIKPNDRFAGIQRDIAASWLRLIRSGQRDALVSNLERVSSTEDKTLTFLTSLKRGELK